MRIFDSDVELRAEIAVEPADDQVSLTIESRSGTLGGPQERNGQYDDALRVLLSRLANRSIVISDAQVTSRDALRDYPAPAERRLTYGLTLPIRPELHDPEELRLAIAQAVRRTPQGRGSNQKRVTLWLDGPLVGDVAELRRYLSRGEVDPAAPRSTFGHNGVPVGSTFPDRAAVRVAGLHRHVQHGISGGPDDGCDAIVVTGSYAEEDDRGDVIVYTGEGGQDRDTGTHIADQDMIGGNAGLRTSYLEHAPVRVIRGRTRRTRWPSPFTPEHPGYRYDGLFVVESYWEERPSHGFRVFRFRLVRLPDEAQATPMVAPGRVTLVVDRVARDPTVGLAVKNRCRYACQLCGTTIALPDGGRYAEAAHVRPLGRPHDGPDTIDNVLCLCPTCHVRFDKGALIVLPDGMIWDRVLDQWAGEIPRSNDVTRRISSITGRSGSRNGEPTGRSAGGED